MPVKTPDLVGAAVGLAAAIALDVAVGRRLPRQRFALHAVGLPIAAAIYPAARSDRRVCPHLVREVIALAGFAALSVAAAQKDAVRGRRLLAGGWVGHAVFDAVHDGGEHSRIPGWYPALCAGYDVATAARLVV